MKGYRDLQHKQKIEILFTSTASTSLYFTVLLLLFSKKRCNIYYIETLCFKCKIVYRFK